MSGVTSNERSELDVLRASLPLSMSIDVNYGAPRPVPDQAGDPFQNDMRHPMIAAFAKVVLSKMCTPCTRTRPSDDDVGRACSRA